MCSFVDIFSSSKVYEDFFFLLQSYVQAEIEQLRLELQNTITMYKRACEELVHTQSKVLL